MIAAPVVLTGNDLTSDGRACRRSFASMTLTFDLNLNSYNTPHGHRSYAHIHVLTRSTGVQFFFFPFLFISSILRSDQISNLKVPPQATPPIENTLFSFFWLAFWFW